jgi:hypothetical protein
MRLSLPLAIGVVMLMTASADAHSRVFVGARVGVPAHPIVVAPSAVVVSPSVPDALPLHVTVPPRRVGPKVILVEPTGSTRQR